MESLTTIPALGDNFIHLYAYDSDNVVVVDPGDSVAVINILEMYKLNATTILLTHHHVDHTGGAAKLKVATNAHVIGSDGRRMPGVDQVVYGGETIELGKRKMQVISTPGHSSNAVCYLIEPKEPPEPPVLFTGDTLFVAGCGRIFEASAESMYESIIKLTKLPGETVLCCGHDYTVENYEFALSIEPENKLLKEMLEKAKNAKKRSRAVSTIAQEMQTNPFLRADSQQIRDALNMPQAKPAEVFAELRRRKDYF